MPPSATPPSSRKRGAPEHEDDELTVLDGPPAPKRARVAPEALTSPSKRRKLDEDGLVLLEGQDEELEDEVIVIE